MAGFRRLHGHAVSRLNVSDGMTTPLAQAEYEKFFVALGKPVHHR